MYILDLDNTLLETKPYGEELLINLSNLIAKLTSEDQQEILKNILATYDSTTANFFNFAKSLAQKYNLPYEPLKEELINTMLNSSKYIFEDVRPFLKNLKKTGERICILTFVSGQQNLPQQAFKLAGTNILDLVDEVYITSSLKFNINIDIKNSTVVDDSPRDIRGFYYRLHPELEEPETKKLHDYEIQTINYSDIFQASSFNKAIMQNLISTIIENSNTDEEKIIKYLSKFELDSPNYQLILECLSAQFKIDYYILKETFNSTIKKSHIFLIKDDETSLILSNRDNQIRTQIDCYNVKSQNLKEQVLQFAYSELLSFADVIHITNQPNKELTPQNYESSQPGRIIRVIKPNNEKRTSKKLDIPNPESILVVTDLRDIPIQEKIKMVDNNE